MVDLNEACELSPFDSASVMLLALSVELAEGWFSPVASTNGTLSVSVLDPKNMRDVSMELEPAVTVSVSVVVAVAVIVMVCMHLKSVLVSIVESVAIIPVLVLEQQCRSEKRLLNATGELTAAEM